MAVIGSGGRRSNKIDRLYDSLRFSSGGNDVDSMSIISFLDTFPHSHFLRYHNAVLIDFVDVEFIEGAKLGRFQRLSLL